MTLLRTGNMPTGTLVVAAEDIHFGGVLGIEAGRPGIIERSGAYSCDVRFANYPWGVLCFWGMVTKAPPKPAQMALFSEVRS